MTSSVHGIRRLLVTSTKQDIGSMPQRQQTSSSHCMHKCVYNLNFEQISRMLNDLQNNEYTAANIQITNEQKGTRKIIHMSFVSRVQRKVQLVNLKLVTRLTGTRT
jgi:hypothetical protein